MRLKKEIAMAKGVEVSGESPPPAKRAKQEESASSGLVSRATSWRDGGEAVRYPMVRTMEGSSFDAAYAKVTKKRDEYDDELRQRQQGDAMTLAPSKDVEREMIKACRTRGEGDKFILAGRYRLDKKLGDAIKGVDGADGTAWIGFDLRSDYN